MRAQTWFGRNDWWIYLLFKTATILLGMFLTGWTMGSHTPFENLAVLLLTLIFLRLR